MKIGQEEGKGEQKGQSNQVNHMVKEEGVLVLAGPKMLWIEGKALLKACSRGDGGVQSSMGHVDDRGGTATPMLLMMRCP